MTSFIGYINNTFIKLSISKFYENNVTHVKTEYKLWLQWIISSVYQAITEWSSLERICGGSMGPTHIVVYRFPRRQIGVPPQWGVVRLHILRKTWPWKTVGNVLEDCLLKIFDKGKSRCSRYKRQNVSFLSNSPYFFLKTDKRVCPCSSVISV
jgi:hypothetical protein